MSSCSGNCSSCGSADCGDRKAQNLKAALNPKSSVKKVIFNVFKDLDREIYARLLRAD